MAQDVKHLPKPSLSNGLQIAGPGSGPTSTEVRMVRHLPEPMFPDTGMVGMVNGLSGLPGIDPGARFQASSAYPEFYYEQNYVQQQWTPSMDDYYNMERPFYDMGVCQQYVPNDVPYHHPHHNQQYSVLPPSTSGMQGDRLQVVSPVTPLVEQSSNLQSSPTPVQGHCQSKFRHQNGLPIHHDTQAKASVPTNPFRKAQAQKDYEDNGHATGNPATSTR